MYFAIQVERLELFIQELMLNSMLKHHKLSKTYICQYIKEDTFMLIKMLIKIQFQFESWLYQRSFILKF